MRVSFVGHASILIETRGVSILSDPWWRGPCFGAQWWNYPPAQVDVLNGLSIDYIYISHGHHDHFHPGTLSTLATTAKLLVSSRTDLASSLRQLGYQVEEVADDELKRLGNGEVTCRIMETHGGDTLMAVSDGHEVCVNLNDALHAAPAAVQKAFVARLKALYPKIDYLFCGYGVASHFPNCYVIPGKNREATAARRQRYFNRQWAHLVGELDPKFAFPFAADVVFLEDDLFWANEVTHNTERPIAAIRDICPQSRAQAVDIAPGFAIEDGRIVREALRKPIRADVLKQDCADQIARANRYGSAAAIELNEVVRLLRENLDRCSDYLRSAPFDYRFLIRLRGSDAGIIIEKRGRSIELSATESAPVGECDLVYTTRLAYLKWALTREYGDEILLVGSGGIFEYRSRTAVAQNLHRELVLLLRSQAKPPASRDATPGLIAQAKKLVKRAIGRADQDLYDLNAWTVFE
jgi:L-ascorbate metabolism protein UlaG (beta-lactamase superfamily)